MRQRYVIIPMIIGIALFVSLSVYTRLTRDSISPRIEIPEESVTYEEGTDTSVLLEGVSAWDNVDDNITEFVRVDSVIPNEDYKSAVVTYAVYDSSNNVGKVTRTVKFIPLEKEEEEDE